MTNDMLNERLRALDPVDRVVVGEKAQVLMREILEGEGPRRARPVRRRARLASSAAALATALVVGGIATTPGQAVTNWVGQRIGVSSPAGETPAMQRLRDFAHQGASPAGGQPATVLARGDLPYGRHYELVAYRPKPTATAPPVCFELDFPEVRSLGTAGCEVPATSTALVVQTVGENASATQSFSYATGLVGDDVATVDVTAHGHPADVHLVRLPADVLKAYGIDRPLKFFLATFATGADGPITATARSASGAPLAAHAFARSG
ncbi:MAG TPA: hypothetical protein VGM33_15380 [Baekduia sp.]|jgi:hypothetical protein